VPPRVFFGSSMTLMPLASVRRTRRASMLAGVGSKTSPACTVSVLLNSAIAAARSELCGIAARSGLTVGMNTPSTRLAGLK
jgi:hypothetical protein